MENNVVSNKNTSIKTVVGTILFTCNCELCAIKVFMFITVVNKKSIVKFLNKALTFFRSSLLLIKQIIEIICLGAMMPQQPTDRYT